MFLNMTHETERSDFRHTHLVWVFKEQTEQFSLDFGHKWFEFWTIGPKIVGFEPKSPKNERSVFGQIYVLEILKSERSKSKRAKIQTIVCSDFGIIRTFGFWHFTVYQFIHDWLVEYPTNHLVSTYTAKYKIGICNILTRRLSILNNISRTGRSQSLHEHL